MPDGLEKKRNFVVVLLIILLTLAVITAWSKQPQEKKAEIMPSTETEIKPPATIPPTTTQIPTATSTSTPTLVPSPTQPEPTATNVPTFTPFPTVDIRMHGYLNLVASMVGGLVHENYILMPDEIRVDVMGERNDVIRLEGEPPWVSLSGTISSTGYISATGYGEVAGLSDTSVWLTGTLESHVFTGYLTMGAHHELPGGEPGVYQLHGFYEPYVPELTPTPTDVITTANTLTNTFQIFIDDFNHAMQNVDIDWLFRHLHPAVIERYSPDLCRSYLVRTIQSAFEINVKDWSGPVVWSWEVDDVAVVVNDAFTAHSELRIQDNLTESDVHFALFDGQFTWFTTCISDE
jgi:hypothetical protein